MYERLTYHYGENNEHADFWCCYGEFKKYSEGD